MPKADDDKPKAKLFDVAHPGKSAPSSSSRPIIVSHGPIMADPMMQKSTDSAADSSEVKPVRKTAEKVLVIPDEVKQPVEASAGTEVEAEPKADEAKPEAKPAPESEPAAEPEKPAEPNHDDNSEAVVDSVVEQAADKKKEQEAEKQAAEQAAKVADLVEKKTYFVPINVAKHRRSNRIFLILAMVLVLVAGGGFAAYTYLLK